jgi:hypothetical protein
MALVLADRVQETTTTTGTGTITLAGAVSGFQSFAVIGTGNTTYYTITSGVDWEVGVGTYTAAGTTLARTTVLASSAGGLARISLTGTSNVFVVYPAGKAIFDLADATAKTYLVGTELMLAEDAGVQYQVTASAVLGSSFTMTQSAYALTNTAGTLQKIFNGSTNGSLTLVTGTYVFELMLYITGMSATSGNVAFSLVGAGTATIGAAARSLMQSVGVDNTTPGTPVALNGFGAQGTIGTITPLQIAATGTALASRIHGAFDMTGGSTLIPSISLANTGTAPTVQPGSYLLIRRVAPTATATVGNWS